MSRKIPPWRLPSLPGENEAETNERRNRAYFEEQLDNNMEWFQRMGGALDFVGKRVLEIGCGHGALSVFAAEHGAAQVVGLDLDESRIDFARRYTASKYPHLAEILHFEMTDAASFNDGSFDMIISKDTFEHIEDVEEIMGHFRRLLCSGGTLAIGFSPLYYSPYGDHGRFRLGVPWLHAILPESLLVLWISRLEKRKIKNALDLGLNKLMPYQFRQLMKNYHWASLAIEYNRGNKRLFWLFNKLRCLPLLERYFTVSIYVLATKP